ncbi:MAG: CinA family protein [Candidatus Hydrogenedentota bacterium]
MAEKLLEEKLGDRLRSREVTVATAESCCGGLIAHRITNVSGSSAYFAGGVVSYSNDAKMKLLGVEASVLDAQGAVSESVAKQMADGAVKAFEATYAVSVTGVAGPTGGSDDKPVGTVWLGVTSPSGTRAEVKHFSGDRDAVKRQTADRALELLLEVIE